MTFFGVKWPWIDGWKGHFEEPGSQWFTSLPFFSPIGPTVTNQFGGIPHFETYIYHHISVSYVECPCKQDINRNLKILKWSYWRYKAILRWVISTEIEPYIDLVDGSYFHMSFLKWATIAIHLQQGSRTQRWRPQSLSSPGRSQGLYGSQQKESGWWLGHPSEKSDFVNWDD